MIVFRRHQHIQCLENDNIAGGGLFTPQQGGTEKLKTTRE